MKIVRLDLVVVVLLYCFTYLLFNLLCCCTVLLYCRRANRKSTRLVGPELYRTISTLVGFDIPGNVPHVEVLVVGLPEPTSGAQIKSKAMQLVRLHRVALVRVTSHVRDENFALP